MRHPSGNVMPVWAPRFNKAVNNRVMRLWAPYLPPYLLVLHRGRKSGTEYRTPVLGFRAGDTILIALPYGDQSDWVRNLEAAETGVVVRKGRRLAIRNILVTERHSETVRRLPPWLRLAARTPKVLVADIA